MKNYIYLDNNATTQLDKKVLKTMLIDLKGPPYNPSSIHAFGRKALSLLIESKKKIASLLKIYPDEIVFTSGGTEAVNLLINGIYKKGHIITTDIEHQCVYNTLLNFQKKGTPVSFLKTGLLGKVTPKQIKEAIREDTSLIILSAVNSETGIKIDMEEISEIAYEKNISFIIDAVQLLGKSFFTIKKSMTGLAFSGHKIHGPKGIGFAYIKKNSNITPLIIGGKQENNLRAGTENLSGILGLTKAIELSYTNLTKNIKKIKRLRDHFENFLVKKLNISIIGEDRICNVSNMIFKDVEAEDMLILLDQKKILASHGSACAAGSISRVLLNMGIKREIARSAIRFSFSRFNTFKEIKKAEKEIIRIYKKLLLFKK
ncbi:MAG: hypothetical protein AMS24_04410 [Chlamydiae bacterium SM23_39]|nr:MAG: hypothetical protein AMS24_04410 [Chlamydiae bacterium SM23_39]